MKAKEVLDFCKTFAKHEPGDASYKYGIVPTTTPTIISLAKYIIELQAKYQALEKAAREILLPPSDPHMDSYGIREEMNRREINLKRILHRQQLTHDGARND